MSGELLYTQADLDFFSANADDYYEMAARYRTALEAIGKNAEAWHGPEPDMGHVRALAVIAKWAKEALAEQTVTTLKLEEAK